jgi:hypothetical protein
MPRPFGDTSPPFLAVEIDRALARALRPEAARRETTVPRLIADLLTVMADEPSLIAAVLDDDRAH